MVSFLEIMILFEFISNTKSRIFLFVCFNTNIWLQMCEWARIINKEKYYSIHIKDVYERRIKLQQFVLAINEINICV